DPGRAPGSRGSRTRRPVQTRVGRGRRRRDRTAPWWPPEGRRQERAPWTLRDPAHPPEPADPCCLPALGEFTGWTPRGVHRRVYRCAPGTRTPPVVCHCLTTLGTLSYAGFACCPMAFS